MHILLCNERFLFRYGVDRVLLILSKYLRERGHFVTIMGVTMDMKVAESVADYSVCIPAGEDYYNINEYVEKWLVENWDSTFSKTGSPDLVLNCGWPFFTIIPFLRAKTKGVIFHDYGVVPIYEYDGGTLKIQTKVRELRKRFMRFCDYVITISDYVAKTTYEILPEYNIPVHTIHLGTDHMEMGLWNTQNLDIKGNGNRLPALIRDFRSMGKKLIINLGRWENKGYKNSRMMFAALRRIKERTPNVILLVLAEKKDVDIPEDLSKNIVPLGFVSDDELIFVMQESDLGIAPTLWEGFNLPLAEMQYYEKPVLVFNVGAHPEVIVHPWCLCNDLNEMVNKADWILQRRGIPGVDKETYVRFREYFTWERCAEKCYQVFMRVLDQDKYDHAVDKCYLENALKAVVIVMDMTNPAKDPANPGIIRVCRCLAAHLQKYVDPIFVIWSEADKEYVLPTRHECEVMGTYHGPALLEDLKLSPDTHRVLLSEYMKGKTNTQNKWILLPDIVFPERGYYIHEYCKREGYRLADIFYDDIPYKLVDIYSEQTQKRHAQYMLRLAESDAVLAISHYSKDCLIKFLKEYGVLNHNIYTTELPGEFNSADRVAQVCTVKGDVVQFLCVSTLEPRKNHKNLIDACLMMEKAHPELKFKLVMIGNRYPGHFDIAEYAEEASKQTDKIEWIGIVSDEIMRELVINSRFTVYTSKMEGYGLPIMESIWQGKPCICSSEGAMGELAEGGGCYTVDVNDVEKLSKALYRMCSDQDLILRLTREAVSRKIISWDEYTKEVLNTLFIRENELIEIEQPGCLFSKPSKIDFLQTTEIESIIYSYVQRMQPFCSVAIGALPPSLIKLLDKYSGVTFIINGTLQSTEGKYKNALLMQGDSFLLFQKVKETVETHNQKINLVVMNMKDLSTEHFDKLFKKFHKGSLIVSLHDKIDSFTSNTLTGNIVFSGERMTAILV